MKRYNYTPFIWGSEFSQDRDLTPGDFAENFSADVINRKKREFYEKPIDDILGLLERTGARFGDKNSHYYRQVYDQMPSLIDYSPRMVETGLGMIPSMLSRKNLSQRLYFLKDYHCLDHACFQSRSKLSRAVPAGLVTHIAAGNVFLGSIDSLIYGIITKNLNILKLSRQDFLFPSLFMNALLEEDTEGIITPYISMVYWSREDKEIDSFIKQNSDAILLFGGQDAVISYKNGLSAKTEVHAFGPKISFGLVLKDADRDKLREYAEGFARDIVYWEQRACTSCQNIFIEETENTRFFIDMLFEALEEAGRNIPQKSIPLDSAVEIRKQRELYRWHVFNNEAEACLEGTTSWHTVIAERNCDLTDSPLNRTVYVNIVRDCRDILSGNIRHMKYYLSTVALGGEERLQEITGQFVNAGVLRFCLPGSMSSRHDPESTHDGVNIAELLIKRVAYEDLSVMRFGLEFLPGRKRDNIILARLNHILDVSQKSPFYRDFYRGVELPLKSLDDFKKIPVLEKSHLTQYSCDKSFDMLTGKARNCYIFSAGGTTGSMKYVCYSYREFEESEKVFGYGFKAAGINERDIVANLLKSGAFWTAFIAVNKGLEETGCRVLSMTGNQNESQTISYMKAFRANVMLSVPSNLLFLAQYVENNRIDMKLDKIFYAGEVLSRDNIEYLKKVFNAGTVSSFGYAAVEIGPIGFQCSHCRGTQHHVFEDYAYLEDIDSGDALVTALTRELHPIIRYRICDRIEWVDEPCGCGRTAPRFRLQGRMGDMIKLNYCNLYLSEVEHAISCFSELSPFYQIHIEPVGKNKRLVFFIELKEENPGLAENRDFIQKVLNRLKASSKGLASNWEERQIDSVVIRLVSPGNLERVGRTGKIKHIVDKR